MSAEGTASHPGTATTVTGEGLRVAYGGHEVLRVDSVTLSAGQTYALLGASGAGKSTLLRVLGALENATEGIVRYDDVPVTRRNLAFRRRVSAVFQKPHLLRGSVATNVGYGLRVRGVRPAEARQRVSEVLARVGLGGWEDRSALTLSGGEAQRVALARAIVLRPNLLLLDEPLSYLDPMLRRGLTQEFAEILSSEHVTTFYVTHDQDEAAVVADRVGVMREGRIVAEGDPRTVLTLPSDDWVASFLGTETAVSGVVVSAGHGTSTIECGEMELIARNDYPVGSRVALGIRPEDVMLYEARAPLPFAKDHNRLSVKVVRALPAGIGTRVVVRAGSTRLSGLVSRSSAPALRVSEGASLTAVFRIDAVRVCLADGAGRDRQ